MGYFVISLDFELMWGVHDVTTIAEYKKRLLQTRRVIPQILELFERYSVHATWATVGLLFAENKKELAEWIPPRDLLPSYVDQRHSNYLYFDQVGDDEEKDGIHYGRNLIRQIRAYRGQEIASHTFSHYYCLEEGQSEAQFENDLKKFNEIAACERLNVCSIIFPRNQCNEDYLAICKSYGFKAYRGMENSFINSKKLQEQVKRYLRFIDSFIPIGGHHCYNTEELTRTDNMPMNIPSSCFFRPYIPKRAILEKIKIWRIKRQMHYAAKHNMVFHMWWHPHNMGLYSQEMLKELEELLQYAQLLDSKYGFLSVNMGELVDIVQNKGGKTHG